MPIIDVYKGFKILHTQKSLSGSCIRSGGGGGEHPAEGPIWPSQLLQGVPKLSVSPVSEASPVSLDVLGKLILSLG